MADVKATSGEGRLLVDQLGPMLDVIQDELLVLDRDLRCRYANQAAAATLGCRPSDLVGRPVHHIYPDLDPTVLITALEQAHLSVAIPIDFGRPLGGRWLEGRIYPADEGYVLSLREVTAARLVEAVRRESDARFRTSIENLLDAFGIYSAIRDDVGRIVDFRIEYVNAAACVSNHLTREEQVGRRLLDILPHHRDMGLFALYCHVVETGESVRREEVVFDASHEGRAVHSSIDIQVAKLGDGFTATWHDVTDRKRAEIVLRQNEERLERMIRRAPFPIVLHADDGAILLVNDAWTTLSGYTADDTPTVHDWLERAYGPRSGDVVVAAGDLYAIDGPIDHGEFAILTAQGEQRTWHFSSAPMGALPDARRYVLSMAMDVTERRQAEEERVRLLAETEAARRQAEAALRLRDDLLTLVSHDLLTPLTAIKGFADLMQHEAQQRHGLDDARISQYTARIDSAARKMNAMLDELADLARLQVGQPLQLHPQQVDLVALARDVASQYQSMARQHTVAFSCPCDSLIGIWDRPRLQRVLDNLLSNAVKYSPVGGRVSVSLAEEVEGERRWATLRVDDQGIGIPSDDLPHVFGRFRRARNAVDTFEGAGIGLASVRQIVEQHGGTVTVMSEEGRGATFTVRLPLEAHLSP